MRNYVIDSLSQEDLRGIASHLAALDMGSSIEDLFWLPVPESLLSPTQQEHLPTCGPYCLGLAVEKDSLVMELLVRGKGAIHCPCIAYAPPALREHMISWLDTLLDSLSINV